MKKTFISAAVCCLLICGCGGMANLAGNNTTTGSQPATGSSSNSTLGALGNILSSVIGLDKVTQASLIKTWKYEGP